MTIFELAIKAQVNLFLQYISVPYPFASIGLCIYHHFICSSHSLNIYSNVLCVRGQVDNVAEVVTSYVMAGRLNHRLSVTQSLPEKAESTKATPSAGTPLHGVIKWYRCFPVLFLIQR